jgi:hypothetical protein
VNLKGEDLALARNCSIYLQNLTFRNLGFDEAV